ncbi:uncharacterized protein LOC141591543 isoform X2 [Silene latifolia]|uniref:uncharacterized protein LOC141591543 isoform X2 n=1 Tax=Silene latifolia TaxID=37657 RepID=UPI003D77EEF6
MNSQHHASLGRRTLEEIRQKRAAERMSKASSGSDLSTSSNHPDNGGIKKSDSVSKLSEDVGSLVAQIRDLQNKNAVFEDENNRLSSKLETKEVECETLQKRLNDLEQISVPSLRKALRDVAMEKDAAVVAREDLSAQLRTLKKRLKEAEEEQYRAEEDAAALRAELNSIHQQAINDSAGSMSSMGSPDQIHIWEKELNNLKLEFERELKLRQQEQQRLAEEQARVSALMSEKEDLELKLAKVLKTSSDDASRKISSNAFTFEDKEKLENQLHDMAVMVERLESGRQKLLLEIDSQSSEIERLFEENSSLTSAYQEAAGVASHWENQVKECLKHNEELRGLLDQIRTEQIRVMSSNGGLTVNNSTNANHFRKDETGAVDYTNEVLDLKGQLATEQSRAEGLSAEVMQLSLKLQQATRAYTNLARLYKPVLRNIESSLVKMKHDTALPVK